MDIIRIMYIILFFILGLVFGSFYNVVAFRLSNKESLVKPRSHCPKCGHVLSSLELIPVISFLIQKGRCRACKEKISCFYPLMELLTGVLFALSYYLFGISYELLMALVLSSLFTIVTVTDLNYLIILDEVNIFFAILIFIINIFEFGVLGALKYLGFGVLAFVFMYLLMTIGNILFKEESLGGGDIKLMFVLGMIFTPVLSFTSLSIGALIALPISLFLYIYKKDKVLPFGPFIIIGFIIVYFFKIDINTLKNLFIIK